MFSPVSVIFVERRFGLHTQSVLVGSRAQTILAQRAIAYFVHVAQSNVAQVLQRRCHVPQRASSPVGCRLRLAWKPFHISVFAAQAQHCFAFRADIDITLVDNRVSA